MMSTCAASSSPFCRASWPGVVCFLVASSDSSSSTGGDRKVNSPATEKKSRRRREESLAGMTSNSLRRETLEGGVILRPH